MEGTANSAAARAVRSGGLARPGNRLMHVGADPVRSVSDLQRFEFGAKGGQSQLERMENLFDFGQFLRSAHGFELQSGVDRRASAEIGHGAFQAVGGAL